MLTITKYGKSLCYRKDGNRLGRRKEQDILAKALERSMLKQAINSYAGTVYGGPLDASKCASIGVGSDTVYRGMFGNNNHIHSSIGSIGTNIITIDGIPYNSMDEFDRPVSDKDKAQYLDFQFNARKAYKAEYRLEEGTNTYKPLGGVMLKPNKVEDSIWEAKKWEADNFYPHVVQLNEVPETIEDGKLIMPSSAWDRMTKTENGWKCEHCGVIIGKHLFRTLDERGVLIKSGSFHNFRGTPDFEYIKPKRPITQIAIGEKDINVLKDFMGTTQRVFPNLDVI